MSGSTNTPPPPPPHSESSELERALDDAEKLMEDLSIPSAQDDMHGFSIDSDDEDEDGVDVPLDDSPTGAANKSTATASTAAETASTTTPPPPLPPVLIEESVDVHPLLDLPPSSGPGIAPMGAQHQYPPPPQYPPHQQQQHQQHHLSFPGSEVFGGIAASLSNVSSTMTGGGGTSSTMTMTSTSTTAGPPSPTRSTTPLDNAAAGTASDAWKAQTSRLASNLAGLAQRAADKVVTTADMVVSTAGVASPGGGAPGGSGLAPPSYGSVYPTQQQQQQQSPAYYGQQQAQQQQMQMQQQQSAAATIAAQILSLDKDQKQALVASKVDLLPGERVTMFLAPLLYVADPSASAGPVVYHYGNNSNMNASSANSNKSSSAWCCVLTYYRIILLLIREDDMMIVEKDDNGVASMNNNNSTAAVQQPSPSPPSDWNLSCWPPPPPLEILQMPLASVERLEKSVFTAAGSVSMSGGGGGAPTSGGATVIDAAPTITTTMLGLTLTGKDNGRTLRFVAPSHADTEQAYKALQTYAFPGRRNLGYLFAFESKRQLVLDSVVTDPATGQKRVDCPPFEKRFDAPAEFARLGIGHTSSPWRLYAGINAQYQLCASYPGALVGPASIDESAQDGQRLLRQSAAFRSESRFPALTWAACLQGGGSLWRASQPKVGLQGNRSSADELYLKHVVESAAAANLLSNAGGGDRSNSNHPPPLTLTRSQVAYLTGCPPTSVSNWLPEPGVGLKILDLRPRSSAMANRTAGYGYENTSNYAGTTIQFCNIGNIHAVRDAYLRMSALGTSTTTTDLNWTSNLEDTKWLHMVRLILAAGWEAAWWVHVHRLPVLVHCSHGWDRTSQVAVLAQLMLDPHYRTRRGFATVVEKDFMAFGHPFHTRCAHGEGRGGDSTSNNGGGLTNGNATATAVTTGSSGGSNGTDEGQISPIFMQFLDCVYQLVQQYPECFEFNAKYLLVLSEHVYSCRFGNFLCDTERERELVAGIRQRTPSLWDYLDERDDLTNHGYDPARAGGVLLMPLPTLLRNVALWTDRHCLYGPKPTVRWVPDVAGTTSKQKTAYRTDQQTPLTTVQESLARIAQMTALQPPKQPQVPLQPTPTATPQPTDAAASAATSTGATEEATDQAAQRN